DFRGQEARRQHTSGPAHAARRQARTGARQHGAGIPPDDDGSDQCRVHGQPFRRAAERNALGQCVAVGRSDDRRQASRHDAARKSIGANRIARDRISTPAVRRATTNRQGDGDDPRSYWSGLEPMSAAFLRTVSLAALSLFLAAPAGAAPDLANVRELYASASYAEALEVLGSLESTDNTEVIEQYRALCLLGLGRTADAEKALERIVV